MTEKLNPIHRVQPGRIATALLLLLAPLPCSAFFWGDTLAMEPQPFRQERVLESRTFRYNGESFLQRNSFVASWQPFHASPLPQDHMEGVGGSTRTKELLLDTSIQATRDLDRAGITDFQYRFRRTEDFDGRYSRNLVGVGVHPGNGFQARLMADISGDKSQIDLQPELGWQNDAGNTFRLAMIFPEYLFNSKQGEDYYLQKPVTLFAAGEWHTGSEGTVRGYLNASPETELRVTALERRFRDESIQGGASLRRALHEHLEVHWLAEGEATNRHEHATTDNRSATMERRAWRSRATLTLDGRHVRQWHLGTEFLSLAETGNLIGAAGELTDRDEHLVFAGVEKDIAPHWRFSPELFVTHVDGESIRGTQRQRSNQSGTYSKVSLPFTWTPQADDGPRLTFNPTLELHTVAFGGGNVRVRIPL